ncbi:MAG: hypothetical protein NT116_01880, partial [Candidatus Parcubacteria bacterium]|nr:hypothetical protein [Candidatus Parcubacteria bacterium]
EANLEQNKKSFLFLNRKGSATLVSCKDCGYIAACPTCRLPLTYHKKSEELHCHHCSYKSPILLTCPKCNGPEIKLTGTGTEKAESALKKQFPQSKIVAFDQENQRQAELINADIIIGTQYALEYINWQNIQTIGVLNADIGFYSSDYRALETTYNLLSKFAYLLTDKSKELICQTFSPENYIFNAIINFNRQLFYANEIKERQVLKYPPFSRLIKIIYQSIDYNAGKEEINEIYNIIKLKAESNSNILINPPLLAYTQQVRGRWRWQIIVKILDPRSDLSFLYQLSDSVIIDIDPESLL